MKEAHANMYFSNLFTPDLNMSDFKLKNEICSYIIFFSWIDSAYYRQKWSSKMDKFHD